MQDVTLAELQLGLSMSRLRCDAEGLTWSPATWSRIWRLLTARERTVVYLVAVMGFKLTEAAAELAVSPQLVGRCFTSAAAKMAPHVWESETAPGHPGAVGVNRLSAYAGGTSGHSSARTARTAPHRMTTASGFSRST